MCGFKLDFAVLSELGSAVGVIFTTHLTASPPDSLNLQLTLSHI